MNANNVLALDMVESTDDLSKLLSSITKPQKWAPSRSWCMHCRGVIGTFQRALHCGHCGRFVCGSCSSCRLTPDYFPSNFDIDEPTWVCIPCEKILITRKENGVTNHNLITTTTKSRVYDEHWSESTRSTQPASSYHNDDDNDDGKEEC